MKNNLSGASTQKDALRIGVIGIGNIAQKAYLPVLTSQPGVDLHFMTRDREKLERVGAAYRVPHLYTDLEALMAAGMHAAFVHAPTEHHYEIVTRLLAANIDVFVDKPLSYNIAESRRMVSLARELGRSLMVGFNRRFAPAYTETLKHPRDLVILQKDRQNGLGSTRSIILDDFIHLVDTLRMLAPATALDIDVRGKIDSTGCLHHVILQLADRGFNGLAIMNRTSGSNSEVLQTAGAGERRDVTNLSETLAHHGAARQLPGNDWDSVGHRRGIEDMCQYFLDALRTGKRLDAGDALTSHELCEQIIESLTTSDAQHRSEALNQTT
ncbi:Gfo/Idh/MocA family protein [Pseudarthrobacter sp. N5]|uniref:Gfo/Idh/MocA family protein n=1 Tax=Pseudarthrobacter sp. N5 TaxID=3418416 RepID=UPI003CE68A25